MIIDNETYAEMMARQNAAHDLIIGHGTVLRSALVAYAEHMQEAHDRARAEYDRITADPKLRAAQDASLMTTEGLAHSAVMFADCVTKAQAALALIDRYELAGQEDEDDGP